MRSIHAALLAAACLAASVSPVAAGPSCDPRTEHVAGGTWEAHRVDGIRGVDFTWRMAADENDPRFVVVADVEGILVTRDGGCTWERRAEYTDFLAPLWGTAVDAVVAGSGADRSVHVLVTPWEALLPPTLLSSFDDGATWTAVDAPPTTAYSVVTLAASPDVGGRVYLLSNHNATSEVYAGDGEGEWQLQSFGVVSPDPGACPACPPRPLHSLSASAGELWAATIGLTDVDDALAHSSDEGMTWQYRPVPAMAGGIAQLDAGPKSIMLFGDFWEFAVSRDDGRSWAVGRYPKVTSSDSTSSGVFETARFDHGRRSALLPGLTSASGWSGNVLAFDGRRWTNVSPPEFVGYSRTTADGTGLSFAALASTRGPLLALSSLGELMAFRP